MMNSVVFAFIMTTLIILGLAFVFEYKGLIVSVFNHKMPLLMLNVSKAMFDYYIQHPGDHR